jgi:hypothetical protein
LRRQYIRSEEDASRLGAMAIVARRIYICSTSLDRLKAPAFLMYLPVVQHKNNQIKNDQTPFVKERNILHMNGPVLKKARLIKLMKSR